MEVEFRTLGELAGITAAYRLIAATAAPAGIVISREQFLKLHFPAGIDCDTILWLLRSGKSVNLLAQKPSAALHLPRVRGYRQ
jgi:hypothetical protein